MVDNLDEARKLYDRIKNDFENIQQRHKRGSFFGLINRKSLAPKDIECLDALTCSLEELAYDPKVEEEIQNNGGKITGTFYYYVMGLRGDINAYRTIFSPKQ